jgi:hypothetical protein
MITKKHSDSRKPNNQLHSGKSSSGKSCAIHKAVVVRLFMPQHLCNRLQRVEISENKSLEGREPTREKEILSPHNNNTL